MRSYSRHSAIATYVELFLTDIWPNWQTFVQWLCNTFSLIEYNSPTFKLHSNIKTFLKSAVWTSFSLCFIDNTISVSHTCVDFLVLNCSLEESFARFASQQTVVIARHLKYTIIIIYWYLSTTFKYAEWNYCENFSLLNIFWQL